MARILRARKCVLYFRKRHGRKVIYILYTIYIDIFQATTHTYTLKQKSGLRQLSRVIAMDSTRTKLENKILRVLIFISSWQYTRSTL